PCSRAWMGLAMTRASGEFTNPRCRSAAGAPAKLRVALARTRRREVGRRRCLERLGLNTEREAAAADARHLHGAQVVPGNELAGQLLHDEGLQVRKAVRQSEHGAVASGDLANELDQLLQRVLARPAQVVDLAVRV